jgi:hypothetical protein
MKPHRTTARDCPSCGYRVDAATPVDGNPQAPKPGDIMMCMVCGEFATEGDDGAMRKPTYDEFTDIADSPNCQMARRAWLHLKTKEREES